MEPVVVAEGLGKRFKRYHVKRPETFKKVFLGGLQWMRPVERFWAVRDVSFSVARGQMLGLIGQNGSGKSTLLKMISGIMAPDAGFVRVDGRIGGLLELGTGFHPELTGRENVYTSGVVAGLLRREIDQRFEDIVRFAELEAFIDSPLRTYSTGMRMRLGFSVAMHTDPQVLLIDEVLTVGDLAFQQKCFDRIERYKNQGCTIILVSHDLGQVNQLCDEALWLKGGQVAARGTPDVVVGQYKAAMSHETRERTPAYPDQLVSSGVLLRVNENRFGSQEMQIRDVRLLDAYGVPCDCIQSGEPLHVEVLYEAPALIEAPIFSVSISDDEHSNYLDVATDADGVTLDQLHGSGRIVLHIDRVDLSGGQYYVDVGVYERTWAYAYDYHWHAYPLRIETAHRDNGFVSPPRRWELSTEELPYPGE